MKAPRTIDGSLLYPDATKGACFLYYFSAYVSLSKNSFFMCPAPFFSAKADAKVHTFERLRKKNNVFFQENIIFFEIVYKSTVYTLLYI